MAFIDDIEVGFIEFSFKVDVGEIACLYVEPNFQYKGVGKALFDKALSISNENNVCEIHVFASHIAKPFFGKQGFMVVRKNTIEKSGVRLENWLMELEYGNTDFW